MLSADYIVGLTDGEGCFYVNITSPSKRWQRVKHRVATHFYIKMREDELNLLKKLKRFFGCGAVYFQKDKRPNHASCYRFEINAQKDIHQILIPFFDQYPLQSNKRKDYQVFREIAMMIKEEKHREKEGIKRIIQLKKQMNLGSRPVRESRTPGGNVQ